MTSELPRCAFYGNALPDEPEEEVELEEEPEPPALSTRPSVVNRAVEELVREIVDCDSETQQQVLSKELDALRAIQEATSWYWDSMAAKTESRLQRERVVLEPEQESTPEPAEQSTPAPIPTRVRDAHLLRRK
jgi:hypothetical protein